MYRREREREREIKPQRSFSLSLSLFIVVRKVSSSVVKNCQKMLDLI
jgi:hypothetical protein